MIDRMRMSEFDGVNFFTDRAVQDDPYPYFDWVREQGPVWQEPATACSWSPATPRPWHVYGDPATFPDERRAVGHVLVVQRGQRPVREVLGPVEGDDITDIAILFPNWAQAWSGSRSHEEHQPRLGESFDMLPMPRSRLYDQDSLARRRFNLVQAGKGQRHQDGAYNQRGRTHTALQEDEDNAGMDWDNGDMHVDHLYDN